MGFQADLDPRSTSEVAVGFVMGTARRQAGIRRSSAHIPTEIWAMHKDVSVHYMHTLGVAEDVHVLAVTK